uniref:NADH-ubiquinone oxidoreductase chain 3 n=1 Tax=Ihlea magalhanica TaxID=2781116 RepID=A0AA86IR99_9UROC|nr:NADH dehydrogenase subunit 3 [Ihlea magalhanica]
MFSFIISMLLVLTGVFYALTFATQFNMEGTDNSMFECGFEQFKGKISYSLQFFTLALSFIAFDYEIFLLLPMAGLLHQYPSSCITSLVIMAILTFLLMIEMGYMVDSYLW